MPPYTTMATGPSSHSQPINVTPRCEWRMSRLPFGYPWSVGLGPMLLDAVPDAAPDRAAGAVQVPIEPDSGRFADQMILRHEAPVAPIVTIIAIIADHKVLARRHLDLVPVAVVAHPRGA